MTMDRAEIQDAARRAFAADAPAGDADATWTTIAEMGFLMMTVPEGVGGLGLGADAAAAIHVELGRALVPGPAIAQMIAIAALAAADGVEGRDALLEAAMAGELLTASLAGGAATDDTLTLVPDADRATRLLHVAPGRIALIDMAGLSVTSRQTWDRTRRLFDVAVPDDAPALVLARGTAADALAERLSTQLSLALAADSLGAAEAVLAMTIAHLETRRQFDRPLAMFQALKHRVADMKTALAAADALSWARALDPATDAIAAGALKAHACTVSSRIAEEAIQLHGGIGLTMEHPCHLFLKRTFLDAALGRDADHWNAAAGRRVLATQGRR